MPTVLPHEHRHYRRFLKHAVRFWLHFFPEEQVGQRPVSAIRSKQVTFPGALSTTTESLRVSRRQRSLVIKAVRLQPESLKNVACPSPVARM